MINKKTQWEELLGTTTFNNKVGKSNEFIYSFLDVSFSCSSKMNRLHIDKIYNQTFLSVQLDLFDPLTNMQNDLAKNYNEIEIFQFGWTSYFC